MYGAFSPVAESVNQYDSQDVGAAFGVGDLVLAWAVGCGVGKGVGSGVGKGVELGLHWSAPPEKDTDAQLQALDNMYGALGVRLLQVAQNKIPLLRPHALHCDW